MTTPTDYMPSIRASGGCLCGAVRFEVTAALRDVVLCHCQICRKSHGHFAAYTATANDGLRFTEARGLKWYRSSQIARRGFCGECGSSLLWEPSAQDYIAIAAGSLELPTGLATTLQIHTRSAGDYYAIDQQVPQRAD